MGNTVKLNKGLTVYRDNMLDALKKLAGAVPKKSSYEVLEAVEITATAAHIFLTATNYDFTITVTLFNESSFQGKILVNYKALVTFLSKSKADIINLDQLNKERATVKANKTTYNLKAYDSERYPVKPHLEYETVTLSKVEFEAAMKNTLYAASTSESRPVLTGVYIQFDKNGLKFVATDAHRLGQYQLWNYTSDNEIKVVPAGVMLQKALKIVDKKCKEITIGFSERVTLLQFDNVECLVRNLEGNYPDTSRLFPESFKTEITIDRKSTIETLEMLSIIFKDLKHKTVTLENTENKVEIMTVNLETAESMNSELEYTGNEGDEIRINYSGEYMLDVLKIVEENDVKLQLCGAMRPFILKGNENATHLILPVRVS